MSLPWLELHGAITHFPIALLITAVAYELAAFVFRWPLGRRLSFWLLVAAVLMAVPSLVTGWMTGNQLFGQVPSPPAVFVWHRAAAFIASGIALILLIWRAAARDQLGGGALAGTVVLVLAAAGVVGYTGFLGGRMVFGGESQVQAHEGPGHEHAEHGEEHKPPQVDPKLVQAGEKLFQSQNCRSCHPLNGSGGKVGPDLTHEGKKQPDLNWQIAHLKNPAKLSPGSIMPSYAQLKPDELKALAAYMVSRE